jgi:ribosomal protein S18 acetylase RimI-like enzyme
MMIKFTEAAIQIANTADAPAINILINAAYRGEASRQGWTTEAHLIAGDTRTDEGTVSKLIQQASSVILVHCIDGQLNGCVNLQQHDNIIYLGMLSVSPHLQGAGIGKQLLKAAEEYTQQVKCTSIYMTVISVRSELIAWYQRHGYKDTGERKPFSEDGVSGKHLQPLEFMVMNKELYL